MESNVRVAIVILNYNGKSFLEKFLPNVISNSPLNSVVVVDNASKDDSVAFMQLQYPSVRLIINQQNYGFAGGYNSALKQVSAEYYVLLNSDVEVTQNWTEPVLQFLDQHQDVAVAMPKLLSYTTKNEFEYAGAAGGFIDKYGFIFCRGRLFDAIETDMGQYNAVSEIFWATGAALFVRSKCFWEVGGLDADFFAHMEEIDLCWRVKNRGYKVFYIPQSVAYHVGGGTLPKENPFKTYLNFRNNLFLLYKNLPSKGFRVTLFKRKCFDGIAALRFILQADFKNFISIWNAHIHYYKASKQLRQKRKLLLPYNKSQELMYRKSIVFDYFLRKKQKFEDLHF